MAPEHKAICKLAEMEAAASAEAQDFEWAETEMAKLAPEHRAICVTIQLTGLGICSRCRWSSGCSRCSFPKAVRYWLKRNKNEKPELSQALVYGQ